jgi:hypothetical protein
MTIQEKENVGTMIKNSIRHMKLFWRFEEILVKVSFMMHLMEETLLNNE